MEIIKGGSNVAAQFEAAGIEIAKPLAPAETKEEAPKPAEAAPPATPAPATPPEDDEEDEHGLTAAQRAQFTASMRKQIGKKHAQYKEADERAIKYHAEALAEKQRAEAAERRLAELEGKQQPAAAQPEKAPEKEKFRAFRQGEDVDAYWEERDEWNRQKAIRDFQRVETERQVKEAREAQGKAAEALITKASELVPDFAEVTSKANLSFGDDVSEAIWQSERFPEIAYHLAKNPDEATKIRKMTIGKALLAIGKLEATLAPFAPANGNGSAKEPTKPSPAPETESSKPAAGPSKRPAPVLTPIPTGIGTQADASPSTQREHVADFGKREGVNLYARKRH